jgi:DNA-binding IscR family transcriptional regulator
MLPFDECILGDRALHERFLATTEILARLVSSAPRAVGIKQLHDATDRPSPELADLCAALERAGLLQAQAGPAQQWTLTCDPSLVTLEDVYRCVLSERDETAGARANPAQGSSNDLNLLVMQAMIAVNQSVLKHLRQFSLDRLKISAAGMFPAPRRQTREAQRDDAFDLTSSGREASYGSSMQVPA